MLWSWPFHKLTEDIVEVVKLVYENTRGNVSTSKLWSCHFHKRWNRSLRWSWPRRRECNGSTGMLWRCLLHKSRSTVSKSSKLYHRSQIVGAAANERTTRSHLDSPQCLFTRRISQKCISSQVTAKSWHVALGQVQVQGGRCGLVGRGVFRPSLRLAWGFLALW